MESKEIGGRDIDLAIFKYIINRYKSLSDGIYFIHN